jgi:hypothetical protein
MIAEELADSNSYIEGKEAYLWNRYSVEVLDRVKRGGRPNASKADTEFRRGFKDAKKDK